MSNHTQGLFLKCPITHTIVLPVVNLAFKQDVSDPVPLGFRGHVIALVSSTTLPLPRTVFFPLTHRVFPSVTNQNQ